MRRHSYLASSCLHVPGGGGAQAPASIVLYPLAPVHLPGAAVYDYVAAKILGDLPALREPGSRGGGREEFWERLRSRPLSRLGRLH